jgi:uncharacterized protein (DUF3084 family)
MGSNSITIDSVLLQGDRMYRNAFENGLIASERYLSIDEWLNDFQAQIQQNEAEIQPKEAEIQHNEAQTQSNEAQIQPNEAQIQPNEAHAHTAQRGTNLAQWPQ